jgi:hypothetical protein
MLTEKIASLDREEARKVVAEEAFVARQRILGDLAPKLWADLRQSVKAMCEQNPQHFAFELCPSSQIVVRSNRQGVFLQVEYMENAKRVHYQTGSMSGEYRITLDMKENVVFVDASGISYPSASFVADQMLEGLLP